MHTGTANQGHYFSYIRDPNLDAAPPSGGEDVVQPRSSPLPPPPPAPAESPSTTSLSVDDSGGSTAGDEMKDVGASPQEGPEESVPGVLGLDERVLGGVEGVAVPAAAAVASGGRGGEVKGTQTWCEFNDTVVKEWGVAGRRGVVVGEGARDEEGGTVGGLEVDCFGGQQTMQVGGGCVDRSVGWTLLWFCWRLLWEGFLVLIVRFF